LRDNDLTKLLGWPGYRVCRHEINERAKTLKLWIRRKRGNRKLGIKMEKVPQLPSKAPFSKRFEDAVGQACESAAARQVALRFGLPPSTVRAIDLRYLERGQQRGASRRWRKMGVDEIYLGKKQKFITVVSNLDSGERA
jgi:hypothetical protein